MPLPSQIKGTFSAVIHRQAHERRSESEAGCEMLDSWRGEGMNDGGPAFPKPNSVIPNGNFEWGNDGMTLRDYFAATALTTMKLPNSWTDNPHYWEGVARSAWVCADAMIAERDKTK